MAGGDPVVPGNTKDPVDIPTFDEWKKQVMEVEKEKSKLCQSHGKYQNANG